MYELIDETGTVRDTATTLLEAKTKQIEWAQYYYVTLKIQEP